MAAVGVVLAALTAVRPVVWTIAGSDSGGGAGLQADLLTFHSLGVHGCTVPTALTAQSSVEVRHVEHASAEMLRATLATLRDDLLPAAIKIGMCGTHEVIAEVAAFLAAEAYTGDVVCDPVMVTTSGTRLLDERAAESLVRDLFPRCRLITPNLHEAEELVGRRLDTPAAVERAAQELLSSGCGAVLIKGGHATSLTEEKEATAKGGSACKPADEPGDVRDAASGTASTSISVAQDFFTDGETSCWLSAPRLPTSHTHGTGCTLSSAIAALLARGLPLLDAVTLAKAYVTQGIAAAVQVGAGPGPVAHTGWPTSPEAMPWMSASAAEGALPPRFARCAAGEMAGVLPVVDTAALVAEVVGNGVRHVQLRLKGMSSEAVHAAVAEAQAACVAHGARLWVNDHWEAAVAAGAYGVHVGQEDLAAMTAADLVALAASGARFGVSTHSYAELATALAVRPSYISLGPIYATNSKDVSKWGEQGLERLAHWRSLLPEGMPLIAIGGVSLERAPSVMLAGADGIAVIGAITKASDRPRAIAQWLALWEGPADS